MVAPQFHEASMAMAEQMEKELQARGASASLIAAAPPLRMSSRECPAWTGNTLRRVSKEPPIC